MTDTEIVKGLLTNKIIVYKNMLLEKSPDYSCVYCYFENNKHCSTEGLRKLCNDSCFKRIL
jgi:hypothetical protein